MTQQPAVTAAVQGQPAPETTYQLVNADELVQQALRRTPALKDVMPQLQFAVGVYVQYLIGPGAMTTFGPEVEDDFRVFFNNTDFAVARRQLMDVMRVISVQSVELAREIEEETGTTVNPAKLDITARFNEETTEQQTADKAARALMANAMAIINQLGIGDLYAQQHQTAEVPEAPAKKGLLVSLGAQMVKMNLMRGEEQVPVEEEAFEPEPVGWLTPLKLDTTQPGIKALVVKVDKVLSLMGRYNKASNMKELVLTSLRNLNLPQAELENLCLRAIELANAQVSQSDRILVVVKGRKSHYDEQINALRDIADLCGAILRALPPSAAANK